MLRPPAYRQQTCTHTQKSPAAAAGKTETLRQTILLSLGKVDQTSCSWVVQTSRLQPYTYPIASCRLLKVFCPTHFRNWSSWTVCASSTRALKNSQTPVCLLARNEEIHTCASSTRSWNRCCLHIRTWSLRPTRVTSCLGSCLLPPIPRRRLLWIVPHSACLLACLLLLLLLSAPPSTQKGYTIEYKFFELCNSREILAMLCNTNYNLKLQSRYWATPTLPVLKKNKTTREVGPCMREENLKKKQGEGGFVKGGMNSQLTDWILLRICCC